LPASEHTNSSPPNRAITSHERSRCLIEGGDLAEQLVADRWCFALVDRLELGDGDERRDELLIVPVGVVQLTSDRQAAPLQHCVVGITPASLG
jgi:hypothetical protein